MFSNITGQQYILQIQNCYMYTHLYPPSLFILFTYVGSVNIVSSKHNIALRKQVLSEDHFDIIIG